MSDFAKRFSRAARKLEVTISGTAEEGQQAQAALTTIVANVTLEELLLLAEATTRPAIKNQAVEALRKHL